MKDIKERIRKIGEDLVKCKKCIDKEYYGVENKPEDGILPRCLNFEYNNSSNIIIVIGLNPGRANKKEMEFYKEHESKYKSLEKCWNELGIKDGTYYARIREFLQNVEVNASILWTELVKCQSAKDCKISMQVYRTCINKFLIQEVKMVENPVLIIACGRIVFEYASLVLPNYKILGIPHPTGSYGYYGKMFNNVNGREFKELKEEIKGEIINFINKNEDAECKWIKSIEKTMENK